MRFVVALLATLLLGLAFAASAQPDRYAAEPGAYIVVLRAHVDPATHLLSQASSLHVSATWSIGSSFRAFAVKRADPGVLAGIIAHPDVEFVTPDSKVFALGEPCHRQELSEQWGLQRTSLKGPLPVSPPISQVPYEWSEKDCGQGVEAHVLDTGIYGEHSEFEGRVKHGFDATGEGPGDLNGHGTHLASTLGGRLWGVARCVDIISVKVLGRSGSGSLSWVISGIQYSVERAERAGRRVVLNLSLGSGKSPALDRAASAAVQAGVFLVAAAGSSNSDAGNSSPAGAPGVVAVGSTDRDDARSPFSNFGSALSFFAPGGQILGAWVGAPGASRILSGTSAAAPHVAGVAAKFWSARPGIGNAEVLAGLVANSNKDLVKNPGPGSPNRLILHNCSH